MKIQRNVLYESEPMEALYKLFIYIYIYIYIYIRR